MTSSPRHTKFLTAALALILGAFLVAVCTILAVAVLGGV